jgi:multidrug efflux pump
MSVSAPFIARPVATSLLAVAIFILGVLGYRALPVSSLPQVSFPTIEISTRLPGANPETMAALVTAPLERQLGRIPALTLMTSTSTFGLSRITLQFDLARDIDGAVQDVQAAINAASSVLPRQLPYPPVYAKINPADTPIITFALTSKTLQLRELSDAADTLIAQRLSEVPGVGSISVQGGLRPAVRVQADLEALTAAGLGLDDLRQAILGASVSAPNGSLDGPAQAYSIGANDQITSAAEYELITVAYRSGAAVLVRDVARVVDGFEDERAGAWHKTSAAVVIDVRKQPGANIVETVARIKAEVPRLVRALPADATFALVSDRTGSIRASIHDVQLTLVLTTALVVLVVLLFLRSTVATLIAATALPLSLIGAFGGMWVAGFSLDNLSLMALTIGTGFVIDDAIVMIENISRHVENGESGTDAAYRGASEIGFTVISLTASLLAVFIPLLFMSGIVGRMFREFALTLSIAVVVSAAVSLTLTPMMCARLLGRMGHAKGAASMPSRRGLGDLLIRGYERTLHLVLARRTETLIVTLAAVAVTIALYVVMPKSFLPEQDTGLITVVVKADPDVSFAEMTRLQQRAVETVLGFVEVADAVSAAGSGAVNPIPNVATLTVVLKAHEARGRSAAQLAREIERSLASIPGLVAFAKPVQDVQIATRPSFSQFQYTIAGSDGAIVRQWGRRLMASLREDPRFRNVSSVEEDEGLATVIDIDRIRAGQHGVSVQTVSDALNSAFSQRQISTIYGQANQYRVILEAEPHYRADPSGLEALRLTGQTVSPSSSIASAQSRSASDAAKETVFSPAGFQVPLSAVASISRRTAPLAISHQQQFPSFTIGFNLVEGIALETAVAAISDAQNAIGVPSQLTGTFAGEAAEFRTSLEGQPWLILAAVIAIYIVLGALYESYVHPITILSTLPSAGIGALLALHWAGEHLTVVGVIGIILLMGIVKKNAILMIDFAIDAQRRRGLSPESAITEACRLRFRPIMMTTLAALFGALPLALAAGPGAELRMPLGVSIVGGLILSQIMTLYTTPAIYLMLDGFRQRLVRDARQ